MKITDIGVPMESMKPSDQRREPIFQKGHKGRFSRILPFPELQLALATQEWQYPRLRFTKDGETIAPHHYINEITVANGSVKNELRPRAISQLLGDGAMLTIDRVHEFCKPINEFVLSLQDVFKGGAHANLYLAGAKGCGFSSHYDCDDTFILQLHGTKIWRLAAPTVVDPDVQIHYTIERAASRKNYTGAWESEYVLKKGDFLYVPRGWWHECETVGEEGSCHITAGSVPLNLSDYLGYALRLVSTDHTCARRAIHSPNEVTHLQEVIPEFYRILMSPATLHTFLNVTHPGQARPIDPGAFKLFPGK